MLLSHHNYVLIFFLLTRATEHVFLIQTQVSDQNSSLKQLFLLLLVWVI